MKLITNDQGERKMTGMKRPIKGPVFILFALAFICIWAATPSVFAEDDTTQLKQVRPAPHYNTRPIDYEQYIKSHFDSWGRFNKAYEGHIVYGDKDRKLAPGVTVPGDIEIGDYVGVMYDEHRLVTEVQKLQWQPQEK